MSTEDFYFSLDIGTRTIVGIVGIYQDQRFKVIDFEIAEHKKRSMFDGQIHDIESVVKAVLEIKGNLEERLSRRFDRVSIAAAGRSLKTIKHKVEKELDDLIYIDKDIISSLEIETVQKSQKKLEDQKEASEYYCVGYAVVNYYLNGTVITRLEGHRGESFGVEVIATFLPKVVVNSLNYVINMAGLTVESMTLEPIAAMNISIQDSFKLLNIALVDIGAGTSDIALTKDGSVFSFAMVPIAGDEITERISQEYLLDFNMSERVKRDLSNKSIIEFEDVMGNKLQANSDQIIKSIESTIKNLAKEISLKIIKYNGKAPSAVFLIGGGSRIPNIDNFIAEYLELPKERVGVRKTDIIKDVEFDLTKMGGPEFITPIGIAASVSSMKDRDFLSVTINNRIIKLLNSKEITVADALIFIAYNPKDLIGRSGKKLRFSLNGNVTKINGEPGKAAIIYVNNRISSLETKINNGDIICIESSRNGASAFLSIKELLKELPTMNIIVNGESKTINPYIFANGNRVSGTYIIDEDDSIEYNFPKSVLQLLDILSISNDNIEILINNQEGVLESIISEKDIIEINNKKDKSLERLKNLNNNNERISVWVNEIQVEMSDRKNYILIDIFNFIDIDLKGKKGNFILKINGAPADYTDIINNGDKIELRWI